MKNSIKLIVYLLLCSIGIGLGFGVAYWRVESDHEEATNEIKNAIGVERKTYAVKRNPAEGHCSGKLYTFYSKGFEIAGVARDLGSDFSIVSAYPTTIEFDYGCQNIPDSDDNMCTSILGAFLTIGVKSQFGYATGKETYLPVEGKRLDEAFERILALKSYHSKYYYAGLKPTYNPKNDKDEYSISEPEKFQYKGRLGVATVEVLYISYQLTQDKEAVLDLNIISAVGGGVIGVLIAFVILKLRLTRSKKA